MPVARRRPRQSGPANLGAQSSRQVRRRATLAGRVASVSSSYVDCGDCLYTCTFCFALFWHDEKLSSSPVGGPFKYSRCCKSGDIWLPPPRPPPSLLAQLLLDPHFLQHVRAYNSMFSMTSFGAKVDHEINKSSGPYVFKVEGQICHRIGTLCPNDDEQPSFLQLYIYDTENEISNRLNVFDREYSSKLRPHVVGSLLRMLEGNNELVKLFRHARDMCMSSHVPDFSIRLFAPPKQVSYDLPSPGTIGAIVFGDDSTFSEYDIVVHHKDGARKRISNLHPSYMSLQYPLLFPFGDAGWSTAFKAHGKSGEVKVTMNAYYSYWLHERENQYSLLLRSGRLFQQYVVDAYVCIEHSRLDYHRKNQSSYRSDLLKGVHDAIVRGDTQGQSVGKRIFLPSSFTGGPRYMYKHYQDALAICRVHGNPQYFITFTCNSSWPEIQRYVSRFPGHSAADHPEAVARVFHMKVRSMIDFLTSDRPFGTVTAHLHTIEFQKRGLPHCHLLLWVEDAFKIRSPQQIDSYISAEIPDPVKEAELYKIVTELMIHGPCGPLRPSATCTSETGTCSKKFPKDYVEATALDSNGYAHYRRTAAGFTVTKNRVSIDNGYVVPYNKKLSLRYSAHINVEYCGWSMLIKYLFKYISKGSDRIRFTLSKKSATSDEGSSSDTVEVDEVQNFLDGRFICPHEASWRILNLAIHERTPAVQVLSVHLEDMQFLTFRDTDRLEDVANNAFMRKTTLTEWLRNNCCDASGQHLRYIDYLTEYRWDLSAKCWIRRTYRKTPAIGRLIYIHPTCGEAFYLRMLLCHQVGCKTFADIRTVCGTTYETYRDACERLGLLGDDKEWLKTFEEAAFSATSTELRSLFAHMLMLCGMSNPLQLWEKYWNKMADDITYRFGFINPEDLQQHVLFELELLLRSISSSATLSNYGLPLPREELLLQLNNRLLMEEKNYDREALSREHETLRCGMHSEQTAVYDHVIGTLEAKGQVLAFVYGHGGTGKTYLWKTIISALRCKGIVVLAVAASGIASLLLPSGRTAHSRFRIPIEITNRSVCNITKNTNLAQLLLETTLIIWDEAPMSERGCFEALDRSLQDLLDKPGVPFGGKSVLLGGDFRQTLPIKKKAPKARILDISLPRSALWPLFKMFKLTHNMRLERPDLTTTARDEVARFSSWLLSVGNGTIGVQGDTNLPDTKTVHIPRHFLIPYSSSALSELIAFIYDSATLASPSAKNLSEKAIVSPTNETVDEINEVVLGMNPAETVTYLSLDTVVPNARSNGETEVLYPVEYLNSLHFNALPPHCLKLKENTPIILLRNINQTIGLCNGTRLIVSQLLPNTIEARIITGAASGKRVYLPRINLIHNDKELPFSFKRKQFPIKVCYAMTINKSQGQSLNRIGIYLPTSVFSHGQLYVALSRATSPHALKILIVPDEHSTQGETKNIVYTDFLNEVESSLVE